MNILEQEIIEKFQRLESDAQQRVLQSLTQRVQQAEKPSFDFATWLAEVEAVRVTLRPDAAGRMLSASELVNEAREERDADILRSIGFRDSAGNSSN